jgi:hypothetical protein
MFVCLINIHHFDIVFHHIFRQKRSAKQRLNVSISVQMSCLGIIDQATPKFSLDE